MEQTQIASAVQSIQNAKICVCIVGEVALNYYNVPRVIHDFELCVPEKSLEEASSALQAGGLFQPATMESFNIYSEYKRGWPRFRSTDSALPPCRIVLFSDTYLRLDPIGEAVISCSKDLRGKAYSPQILQLFAIAAIQHFPMPRLQPLIRSLCERFIHSSDDSARIAVEQLVDGMDLDRAWCESNMSNAAPAIRQLVLRLIKEKDLRVDDFVGTSVTCFVSTREEAMRLREIPGYE